jgi:hypothetical protein
LLVLVPSEQGQVQAQLPLEVAQEQGQLVELVLAVGLVQGLGQVVVAQLVVQLGQEQEQSGQLLNLVLLIF